MSKKSRFFVNSIFSLLEEVEVALLLVMLEELFFIDLTKKYFSNVKKLQNCHLQS